MSALLDAALGYARAGPMVVFVAEIGLRTNEWIALERRDVDRAGAVAVQRRYSHGRWLRTRRPSAHDAVCRSPAAP